MEHGLEFEAAVGRVTRPLGERFKTGVVLVLKGGPALGRMPVHLVLLLDCSEGVAPEEAQEIRTIAKRAASDLEPTDYVSIVTYSTDARRIHGPSPVGDTTHTNAILDTLGPQDVTGHPVSNLGRGLQLCREAVKDMPPGEWPTLVLLAQGSAPTDPDGVAIARRMQLHLVDNEPRRAGIEVFALNVTRSEEFVPRFDWRTKSSEGDSDIDRSRRFFCFAPVPFIARDLLFQLSRFDGKIRHFCKVAPVYAKLDPSDPRALLCGPFEMDLAQVFYLELETTGGPSPGPKTLCQVDVHLRGAHQTSVELSVNDTNHRAVLNLPIRRAVRAAEAIAKSSATHHVEARARAARYELDTVWDDLLQVKAFRPRWFTKRPFHPVGAPDSGARVSIEGVGIATNIALVQPGLNFDIYRADIDGSTVCLKAPAPQRRGFLGVSDYRVRFTSMCLISGSNGTLPFDHERVDWFALLQSEQAAIQVSGGAWNHATVGLGSWTGAANSPVPGQPVLVMPWHEAVPFSDLAPAEKRTLFPRMLPALWAALSAVHHGDLSEDNILLAQDRSLFHLIDPGAQYSSETRHYGMIEKKCTVFVTTPANYPLLPPHCASADGHHGLEAELEFLVRREAAGNDRAVAPGDHYLPPSRNRPVSSDLLALGILYTRILTGAEPFLGPASLLDRPAWVGQLPRYVRDPLDSTSERALQPSEVSEAIQVVLDTLRAGWIDAHLDRNELSPAEKRLARALLNLTPGSPEELFELLP
jgi:hypothetical protein